jgi:hypothetical protein
MTPADLFALLDDLDRGLAREAALDPETRTRRAPQILAWFAPRFAALKEAWRERPCPIAWRLELQSGNECPPPDAPHPCPDCFTAVYLAWKAGRQRVGRTAAPDAGLDVGPSRGEASRPLAGSGPVADHPGRPG